jgi:hypothetical protein
MNHTIPQYPTHDEALAFIRTHIKLLENMPLCLHLCAFPKDDSSAARSKSSPPEPYRNYAYRRAALRLAFAPTFLLTHTTKYKDLLDLDLPSCGKTTDAAWNYIQTHLFNLELADLSLPPKMRTIPDALNSISKKYAYIASTNDAAIKKEDADISEAYYYILSLRDQSNLLMAVYRNDMFGSMYSQFLDARKELLCNDRYLKERFLKEMQEQHHLRPYKL